MQRSRLYLTSSEVISSPLWNLTPWRRWNTVVVSSITSQLSARPGTRFMSLSIITRRSNIWVVTR